jgi:glycosyltransferase involved in cell wall biosynthesis
VALNLRGPSTGGTSGGIFQAFSLGRPVIASDAAEQRELSDTCVLKVPLGAEEVHALARTLVRMRDDPALRARLEQAARDFVERECHWSIVAERYAEHLATFPPPRASRRGLFALKRELDRGRSARTA